jgi:hypothetical protein
MPTRFLEQDEQVPGLDQTTVLDFWRWAYSDVLSNGTRSVFAEFMVGKALGCLGQPRVEWDSVDLHYGDFGIEVKASAACQRWPQTKPSRISFSITKARFWDETTAKYEGEATRSAHCYVFCCHPEQDRAKANVLDVQSWDFYVVPVGTLNGTLGHQKSVSLATVKKHGEHCKFENLKTAVDSALGLVSVTAS